jgi:hypothetical protein
VEEDEFLSWVRTADGIDWTLGLSLAAIGAMGALVATFFATGQPFVGVDHEGPSLGEIKADLEEANQLWTAAKAHQTELAGQADSQPGDDVRFAQWGAIAAAEGENVASLRNAYRSERWRMFLIGGPMYILLGAFFAAALATTFLQALVIGAAWTTVLDRVQLGGQIKRKESVAQEAIDAQTRDASLAIAEKEKALREQEGARRQAETELRDQAAAYKAVIDALLELHPPPPAAPDGAVVDQEGDSVESTTDTGDEPPGTGGAEP